MRGEIERTAIRFDLDDSAGRDALGGAMDEDFADAFARDEQDRAGVKFARQLSRRHSSRLLLQLRKAGQFGRQSVAVLSSAPRKLALAPRRTPL